MQALSSLFYPLTLLSLRVVALGAARLSGGTIRSRRGRRLLRVDLHERRIRIDRLSLLLKLLLLRLELGDPPVQPAGAAKRARAREAHQADPNRNGKQP